MGLCVGCLAINCDISAAFFPGLKDFKRERTIVLVASPMLLLSREGGFFFFFFFLVGGECVGGV